MKSVAIRSSAVASTFAAVSLLGACATAPIPYKEPVAVTPPTGRVAVSQSVTIFDASGSNSALFADSKATLESVVAAMPNGGYDAGHVHCGGYDRETTGVAGFNRSALASAAKDTNFLEGTTPPFAVFQDDLAAAIRVDLPEQLIDLPHCLSCSSTAQHAPCSLARPRPSAAAPPGSCWHPVPPHHPY